MENILAQLYRGEYNPFEIKLKHGAAHAMALSKVDEIEETLQEKLPQELHPMFDQLKRAAMDALDAYGLYAFTIGYQMGVRLMMAAFPVDGNDMPNLDTKEVNS